MWPLVSPTFNIMINTSLIIVHEYPEWICPFFSVDQQLGYFHISDIANNE